MKIKLTTILLFVCVIGWGQVATTGLIARYTGKIRWSDSMLIDTINGYNAKIINLDFDSTFISRGFPIKTGARILFPSQVRNYYHLSDSIFVYDSLYSICFFPNVNFSNKIYAKNVDMTINSDSTENVPSHVKDICFYSSKLTGSDSALNHNYFGVPQKDASYKVVSKYGNNQTGTGTFQNPYKTIDSAVIRSTTGQTIYVLSGNYSENNTTTKGLNVSKSNLIKGLGFVKMTPSVGVTYSVQMSNNASLDRIIIKGINNTTGIYQNLATVIYISNCFISNHSTRGVWARGNSAQQYKSYISNTIINNAMAVVSQDCNSYLNNNIFLFNTNTSSITSSYTTSKSYKTSTKYCKFTNGSIYSNIENNVVSYNLWKYTSTSIIFQFSLSHTNYKVLIKGNKLYADTLNSAIIRNLDSNYIANWNIISNHFEVNCMLPREFINIISKKNITISNNYILVGGGSILYLKNRDSVVTINGNTFIQKKSYDNGANYNVTVGGLSLTDIRRFPCYIFDNNIVNPLASGYGSIYGNHTNLYIMALQNTNIYRNKLVGAGIGSIIYKYQNLSNTNGLDNTNANIYSNVIENAPIIIKGVRNVMINNNTISNMNTGVNASNACIRIFSNIDAAPYADAINNKCYNNILYSNSVTKNIALEDVGTTGFQSDNNIMYGNDTLIQNNLSYYSTLSSWQAASSQDLHSYNQDPQLTGYTPSTTSIAWGSGKYLGGQYATGLKYGATFPNPLTDNQYNVWDIGAVIGTQFYYLKDNNGNYIKAGNDYLYTK
jgi:hypothetical protein